MGDVNLGDFELPAFHHGDVAKARATHAVDSVHGDAAMDQRAKHMLRRSKVKI